MITFKQLGRMGRVGNQMFQIASTIGIAIKSGSGFAFPYWMNHDEKERFSGTDDIDIQKWFKNPLPLVDESINFKPFRVPWGYHDVVVDGNTDLIGHMQSEKYFSHCREAVKHFFEFKNQTPKLTNTVAVHFRGGDYLKHKGYHPPCGRDYYERASKMFDSGFKFLLFTDSPEVAKEVIPFEYELVNTGHDMSDIELMTRCDAHIIANSTYSWWGAWLADSRQVIAPRQWFGHEAKKLTTKDIYPENWIVL